MKKILILLGTLGVAACALFEGPYPYNMTESEWDQLSIQDKAKLRRDFYFYKKGMIDLINPDINLEG